MAISGNTTRRAIARSTPKPKPDSIESIRHQVDDIKTATDLLKVVQAVENAATEPKESRSIDIEATIYDVKVWASTAWLLWQETRWSDQLTKEDGLAMSRIDRVIEKVNEAAEGLYNQYTGAGR
jgi:hypothetical protein